MAITDLADYKARLGNTVDMVPISVASLTTIAGRWSDLWTVTPPVGAAPTTAVAPTRTLTGALGMQNGGAGVLGVVGARFNGANPGVYLVCDRLSHQGGLSGTTTGAQTTNLPTAALTRYTTGEGVMLGVTIYSQVGTTGTTITASYTNQAGTSGQATPLVVFGGTGFREAARMVLLPLAAGDTGVRAVASVTLAASTTTAGNFGVTLFKPLYAIIVDEQHAIAVCDLISGRIGGGFPEVVDDACLFVMNCGQGTNAQGAGALILSEW